MKNNFKTIFKYHVLIYLLIPVLITNLETISFADRLVTTFAGSGEKGDKDGIGIEASFNYPFGVAVDSAGNIYVADKHNHKIRKISPDGIVTTLAGSGEAGFADGIGAEAKFNYPTDVALDSAGNIYVADSDNCKIRKISPSGNVTTLNIHICHTNEIAVDQFGNIYAGQSKWNHFIQKISSKGSGAIIAGKRAPGDIDGHPGKAQFKKPKGIIVDLKGNVYVADTGNNKIRRISPDGVVTTLAGSGEYGNADGPGIEASFAYPHGIALDSSGNIYVGDLYNHKIRKITPDGMVTTIAGSLIRGKRDGPATGNFVARFYHPAGIAVDSNGNIYVADSHNHKIRKIIETDQLEKHRGTNGSTSSP